MSLGALMIQEYPSGVYQPGTTSPDPKICLIRPSLDILYSPFSSSELLTLQLFLPQSGTSINITIIENPISYITYISQVPSTSPIAYQFPMNTHRNIYLVSIYNEDPSLASSSLQLIWDKQKQAISASVVITLARKNPYALTSLE